MAEVGSKLEYQKKTLDAQSYGRGIYLVSGVITFYERALQRTSA